MMYLDTQRLPYSEALNELHKNAKAISEESKDFELGNLASSEFCMTQPDLIHFRSKNRPHEYKLTDFSTSQLCQRLGMPTQYFESLSLSKEPLKNRLACTNINTLAGCSKAEVLLRTYRDTVRGFLSTSYVPFDSDKILEVFHDTVTNLDGFKSDDLQVRGRYLTPERFHLRFTSPLALKGVRDTDLYAGLQIDSSDVGKAALSVKFYIFKQICTNGLCIAKFDSLMFKQRHIRIDADYFRSGLMHSLNVFPDVANKAVDVINSASSVSTKGSKIFSLEEHETLRKNIQVFLRVTNTELDDIVSIASSQYEPTIWGFTNAITQRAREMSFERRVEVERMAGNFLTGYKRLGVA